MDPVKKWWLTQGTNPELLTDEGSMQLLKLTALRPSEDMLHVRTWLRNNGFHTPSLTDEACRGLWHCVRLNVCNIV